MSIYFKMLSALAIIVVLSAVSAKAQTAPQQAQRSNQTVVNSDVNANSSLIPSVVNSRFSLS
jgi:hypothetical protein